MMILPDTGEIGWKRVHRTVISSIVEELSALLMNARVDRVYQGKGGGLYLLLSKPREKYILLVAPDRTLPRLHLVSKKPSADDSTHGFVLYLRSHVSGAQVRGVRQINEDRIVDICFERQKREHRLLFELFDASANLVFIDSSSTILSVYHPTALLKNTVRHLIPGLVYQEPEKPLTTRSRAQMLPEEMPAGSSPNKSAELYYEQLVQERSNHLVRSSMISMLKKRAARNERLIEALSGDLNSAERLDAFRLAGDLILAHLDVLKTGMERADLAGYDGSVTTVALDPKLSPSRNADRFFKKYKKAKAGLGIIQKRLDQAVAERSRLAVLLSRADQARETPALVELQEELAVRTSSGQRTAYKGGDRYASSSSAIRRVVYKGWDILIGRNAAGNDHLTTQIARENDLWLHAEDLPGSHVLVRNPGEGNIPDEVLLKAASLAAFFSRGRHAGKVPVTYTPAGMVRKPKGSKPGLVTLVHRKTIMVRPEEDDPA
jgi:predicted ribosome quality control (RQC) complex YloA/Tae2 family protein